MEYNQPTSAPTQKMSAVAIAGVIVTFIVGIANVFGIAIPEQVSGSALTAVAALTTIVTFAAGYIRKEKRF